MIKASLKMIGISIILLITFLCLALPGLIFQHLVETEFTKYLTIWKVEPDGHFTYSLKMARFLRLSVIIILYYHMLIEKTWRVYTSTFNLNFFISVNHVGLPDQQDPAAHPDPTQ